MKDKIFEELRSASLEDVYYYLCKNEPSKKSKIHEEWNKIEEFIKCESFMM